MINYIKRRLPSGDFQHDLPNSGSITPKELLNHSEIQSNKSKILFIIDEHYVDWKKYFKDRKLFADYDIRIEQATFNEIGLSAHSNGGISIGINTFRSGIPVIRSFHPDFVLVRQYVKDVDVNWINIILGMQYGAVPSINSMRALYNFQDRPWIYAELCQIQRRLGAEKFPLISQTYYPNHRKMFISPPYPSVIKIGHAHQGLGKILIKNTYDYHEITGIIEISQCYSTIEPYIPGRCDIYLQKIGQHYKALRRTSLSNNWKANIGSCIIEKIPLTERYRLWLDEVSQIFGGLDLCAIELIQTNDGKEYIIQINDCTMQLIGENQEEDYRMIADLIVHKMEIYCRPNEQVTILTRISSFDQLPKFSSNDEEKPSSNGNIRQTLDRIYTINTLNNLKQTFSNLFNQMNVK
ncbi:hypothetical protein I4U23_014724 [Adineta vaga]|nr:hypothetical protein I4U23_014724 [Adineta vaga]